MAPEPGAMAAEVVPLCMVYGSYRVRYRRSVNK